MAGSRSRTLACALLLVACTDAERPTTDPPADSAATTAAADSTTLNACDLIGETELEEILRLELDSARLTNDYGGDSQCKWDLPGDAQRGVSLSLRADFTLDAYRQAPAAVDVPGLADAASWNPAVGQLAAQSGRRVVSVALFVADAQRADAERIVRRALERVDSIAAD